MTTKSWTANVVLSGLCSTVANLALWLDLAERARIYDPKTRV